MNNELISIILPVYNVEPYLRKCINSILDQTYTNYELIIINDGSTDNSGNIIKEYKDNRIKVINQDNHGLSYSRNKGIELAKGKYITFIDSDDFIDSKYLEVLYSLITKYDADIAMCDYIKVINDKYMSAKDIYNEEVISKEEVYKRIMLNKGLCFMAWSKLYKTSIFNNIKFPIGKYFEDMYIINDIVESTNKIVVTDYNGYYYLKRKTSITNMKFNNKHLDLQEATDRYKEFMYNNYSSLNKYTNRVLIINYYVTYNKAVLSKECKQLRNNIRNEILKYKKEIYKSNIYSKKEKFQTFLLSFGNNIYKLFYLIFIITKYKRY